MEVWKMVVKCSLRKSSAVFSKYQNDGDETRDWRMEWKGKWNGNIGVRGETP